MRNEIPILKFSSYTPLPDKVGVFLNASRFHGGIETKAVWFHGLLALESAELLGKGEQNWLETVNLICVSESNQIPLIAKIKRDRTLIKNHSAESTLNNGQKVRLLPFSFNLTDILGQGLFDDNFYVHLSVRQYASATVRIARDTANLSSYLETNQRISSEFAAVDNLLQAYDKYSAGKYLEAIVFFEKALANEEMCNDLDRLNLYNAGYCASRFALQSEPDAAKKLLGKTTNWMQEDLKIRNSQLLEIQTKILDEKEVTEIENLESQRLQLLQDLGLTDQ